MHTKFSFFVLLHCSSGTTLTTNNLEKECPDEDLSNLCDTQCRLEFVSCRESCTDSLCDTECLSVYSGCVDSCPCYHDCPGGCIECEHPICACKNLETNALYNQCKNEALDQNRDCLKDCEFQIECFNGCTEEFIDSLSSCPCMPDCSNGCPCESYTCQPFITTICEEKKFSFNYIISANGNFREKRYYEIPVSNNSYSYLESVGSVLFKNEVYIFGGRQDPQKIAKIIACSVEETEYRLLNYFDSHVGSLTTVNSAFPEVLICFGFSPYNACEFFDGLSTTNNPFKTTYDHKFGCLATHNNDPIAISGGTRVENYFSPKVESLGVNGWHAEMDLPKGYHLHGFLSVDDGVITVGGEYLDYDGGYLYTKDVLLFRGGVWTFAGAMREAPLSPTILFFGDYFVSVSGLLEPFTVEKSQWNGTHVISSEIIESHQGRCEFPIVFESFPDSCATACEQFCFP